MASVTHQALLLEGRNPLASSAGWHWPLGIVADAPLWRDTSGFNGYGAWLAAIPFAASNVPKSVTWQLSTSLPNYLLTRSRRLSASLTDDSLSDGSWIYNVPANPTTPRALAWQQPLSALLHSNAVSRLQAPSIIDPSSFSYAWLQAAGVSAPAAAFLARTSGLDATHANAYIALINGLVSDGVWTKFDVLRVYATQDRTTANLNLVSSSYPCTVHGTISFSVDRGYTGVDDSTTDYGDPSFNPTTAAGQYARNSAHLSSWSLTTATAFPPIGYTNGSNESYIYHKFFGDLKSYFRINCGGTAGVTLGVYDGHFIANRSNSSASQGYRNGASVLSDASSSVALINQPFYELGQNNSGTPRGSGIQAAAMSIGSSLSSTDVTNFYNRLRTYMTAVGVP